MIKLILKSIVIITILNTISYSEWVNGYFKKDGTYVNGYVRSKANNTVYDNYSYQPKKIVIESPKVKYYEPEVTYTPEPKSYEPVKTYIPEVKPLYEPIKTDYLPKVKSIWD